MKTSTGTTDGAVRLTLRPLRDPDGVPAVVRIRSALKCLLRRFRLRCEKIEPVVTATTTGGTSS
jgi:hypothetical protein